MLLDFDEGPLFGILARFAQVFVYDADGEGGLAAGTAGRLYFSRRRRVNAAQLVGGTR